MGFWSGGQHDVAENTRTTAVEDPDISPLEASASPFASYSKGLVPSASLPTMESSAT